MVILTINISEEADNVMQVHRMARPDGVVTKRELELTQRLLWGMTKDTEEFSVDQGGSPVSKTTHIALEKILELEPS